MTGRLVRALGAPYRWAVRRGRRALATDILVSCVHAVRQRQGPRGPVLADLMLWDGTTRGGVGVIAMERGSVQAYVEDDGYRVEWHGKLDHPVKHDQVVTDDDLTLRAMVEKWTSGWYLAERLPQAGEF